VRNEEKRESLLKFLRKNAAASEYPLNTKKEIPLVLRRDIQQEVACRLAVDSYLGKGQSISRSLMGALSEFTVILRRRGGIDAVSGRLWEERKTIPTKPERMMLSIGDEKNNLTATLREGQREKDRRRIS